MSSKNVALGEVCIVKRGTTITQKEAIEGEIPVVAGGLKPTYYHNQANRLGNTITISGSGANAGFVNFWNQPIFASDCSTVEVINNKLDITYVYYFLLSKQQYIYNELRSGAAQPHVYGKDIAKIVISIPSLPIQQKIVAKLDAIFAEIDTATAAAEANAKNAEALFQSYLTEIYEQDAKNNKTILLGSVCKVIAGQSPESKNYNNIGEGLAFYQGKKDFGDMFINPPTVWTSEITKEAVKNDILISVRAPVGPVNIATERICIGRGLAAIRATDRINQAYLYSYLLKIKKELIGNAGAVFNSINKTQIENLKLPLPPILKQHITVSKISVVKNNIDIVSHGQIKKIRELISLKQSILQKAFSGELVKD
ncbi:hypothetical protein G6660_09035 [Polynucleobacter paneuropaeus]|nr:hypothetical protein [Polynucleobacter paneuropaeus]